MDLNLTNRANSLSLVYENNEDAKDFLNAYQKCTEIMKNTINQMTELIIDLPKQNTVEYYSILLKRLNEEVDPLKCQQIVKEYSRKSETKLELDKISNLIKSLGSLHQRHSGSVYSEAGKWIQRCQKKIDAI